MMHAQSTKKKQNAALKGDDTITWDEASVAIKKMWSEKKIGPIQLT